MASTDDIDVIGVMLEKGREKLGTAHLNYENEYFEDAVSRLYLAGVFKLSKEFWRNRPFRSRESFLEEIHVSLF